MFFIIFLLLFIVLALFFKPVIINFQADTNEDIIMAKFNWFYPFFKAKAEVISQTPILTIYFLGIRIYSKPIKKKKKNKRGSKLFSLRNLSLDKTYSDVYYGLESPFSTGILSLVIQLVQNLFDPISITHHPDFIPGTDYMVVYVGAELNLGKTIFKSLKKT